MKPAGLIGESYEHRTYSVVPIGNVHLLTGRNELFGSVWNGWEVNKEYANILMKKVGTDGSFIAVHTSDDGSDFMKEKKLFLQHDTTFRNYGQYEVVKVYPHTKEAMQEMAMDIDSKTIRFFTFK